MPWSRKLLASAGTISGSEEAWRTTSAIAASRLLRSLERDVVCRNHGQQPCRARGGRNRLHNRQRLRIVAVFLDTQSPSRPRWRNCGEPACDTSRIASTASGQRVSSRSNAARSSHASSDFGLAAVARRNIDSASGQFPCWRRTIPSNVRARTLSGCFCRIACNCLSASSSFDCRMRVCIAARLESCADPAWEPDRKPESRAPSTQAMHAARWP